MARGSFTLQPCSCMGSLSEPVLTFPFSLQNFKSCLAREVSFHGTWFIYFATVFMYGITF